MKKTKIVCTMGPQEENIDLLVKLIEAGMDVARFNFSHGTHEEQLQRMEAVRMARQIAGKPIAMLLDTKGPEIRVGKLVDGQKVLLEEGRRRYENNVNRARGSQSANANYRNPFQQRASGKPGFASQSGAAVFKPTTHRCEICGRTEASDPDLEFRFCSKCEGSHEYCMDHLYTHTHIITSKQTGSDENLQNQ